MKKRECPECSKEILYKSDNAFYIARKKNSLCKSCGNKGKVKSGEANPFYGKKHSEATKSKLSQLDKSYTQSISFRDKISKVNGGLNNPMFGRTYYQIWLEKYGKEEADRLQEKKIEANRIASSGSRNSMYGKPSPQGSGNGWSGWYKGSFFRSLKELAYIVKVLEPSGLPWVSAERKDLKIQYVDHTGQNRNYYADFLVDNKRLIEIKPEKLQNCVSVRAKQKAALDFCKNNSLCYEMVDIQVLDELELDKLIVDGLVVLLPRYQEKYNARKNHQINRRASGVGKELPSSGTCRRT